MDDGFLRDFLLGPMSGLAIALSGCFVLLRRFERLQDHMFRFFKQELDDCHTRYEALVFRMTRMESLWGASMSLTERDESK